MNLADVIENLVEERGLDRDQIVEIVCAAVESAYKRKYPDFEFVITFNKRSANVDVSTKKLVVAGNAHGDGEVSHRKALLLDPKCNVGDFVAVPFEKTIGRIEVLAARQWIYTQIKGLEEGAIYREFADREGKIVTGVVHKKERAGFAVSVGDTIAFIPNNGIIPGEQLRVGYTFKALLKEVLPAARAGYQLFLDRASALFVQRLLELEIPEIFEGIVEIRMIVRSPGYKTKIVLISNSKDVDPVGTCVGVGGVRIKPILKGLGVEKIDLIAWTDDQKEFIKQSLKPAVIDDVYLSQDGKEAVVALPDDQRAFAIGKNGQNIALASELTGVSISLEPLEGGSGVEDPFRDDSL